VHKLVERLKGFSWQQWVVIAAFLLVLGFTGLHAFRAARDAIYWSYHRDEPIRAWMNVGYVAHSYHVPPPVLYEALGVPHVPHDKRPIREIAREQHRSVNEVIAVLQEAIVRARQPGAKPPPGLPGPPGPPNQGRAP
jgi:hypothetical protein